MSTLSGKVALILGASTRGGIGEAIARAFAGAGARLVLSARRLEGAQQIAHEVGGTAVRCDVTNEDEIVALVRMVTSAHGRLAAFIYAAFRFRRIRIRLMPSSLN